MRTLLETEFAENTARVRTLIAIYSEIKNTDIARRHSPDDLLRAAVVFLHSAVEEIVRNLYLWLLPSAHVSKLNEIPFNGLEAKPRPKAILLGDLRDGFQGKFVENVVFDSINMYVDTLSINNATQLTKCLKMVSISVDSLNCVFADFDALMKRRHQIVHQMDRVDALDPHTYPVADLDFDTVKQWQAAVDLFFQKLIFLLPE